MKIIPSIFVSLYLSIGTSIPDSGKNFVEMWNESQTMGTIFMRS